MSKGWDIFIVRTLPFVMFLLLGVNIIWCPKYRRNVLVGGVETRLKELLPELAEESGYTMLAPEYIRTPLL